MSLSPAELWYADHDHALNAYTISKKVCEPLHRPSSKPAIREGLRELGGQELCQVRPFPTVQLTRSHFAGIESKGGQ